MAKQTINLGTVAGDGTGDTLRVGGDKINDNFTELYDADDASSVYLPLVVDYTGGGATKLDGTVTVGVSVPRIYMFVHTTLGLLSYQLRAGTDAESIPSIIRPDDYAASTNEKVFQAVS